MAMNSQYRTDMKSDSDLGKPVTAQYGGGGNLGRQRRCVNINVA